MAKKKELDNLSLDMIRCKADGFGCHYGHWKALHEKTAPDKEECAPQGWLICKHCGKPFKPKARRVQKYCEAQCQRAAAEIRNLEKKRAYARAYQERKRIESKMWLEA